MLNPHAILLVESNLDTIQAELPVSTGALHDLYADSVKEMQRYWIVAYRLDNGLLTWTAYSKDEFIEEYNVDPTSKFDTDFGRI